MDLPKSIKAAHETNFMDNEIKFGSPSLEVLLNAIEYLILSVFSIIFSYFDMASNYQP